MTKSMFKAKNLSNEYLAEAVACVVYVINISPTKSLMNKVPEEAWLGMSCNVSHFRVFVCVSYAHVPKKIRGKSDDQSEKCIFTSYSEQYKTYKLHNPITNKTIISRDVFKEKESWNGTVEKKVDAQAQLMDKDVAEKE